MPAPALIIIDMQKGTAEHRDGTRNNPGAEAAIAETLVVWRSLGAPVVDVRRTSRTPGSVFWPGQQGSESSDATFALAKNDFNGVYRTAEEVHVMALSNLHGESATVDTAAELRGAVFTPAQMD